MTTVIALGSQKGGVAKTTTCYALGASLAELGQSVLLIDMDPQANLTISFGLDPEALHAYACSWVPIVTHQLRHRRSDATDAIIARSIVVVAVRIAYQSLTPKTP